MKGLLVRSFRGAESAGTLTFGLSKRYYADLAGIKQAAFGDAGKGRGAGERSLRRMLSRPSSSYVRHPDIAWPRNLAPGGARGARK